MVKSSYVYLISILLIMASLSSSSQGLSLIDLNIVRTVIDGVVRSNIPGDPIDPNAPPVSNSTVFLRCAGSTINVAEAVTNIDGAFNMGLSILQTLLFSPSDCGLFVNLPAGNCGFGIPDGVLSAAVTLASIVLTNTTNTAVFVAGPFIDSIL